MSLRGNRRCLLARGLPMVTEGVVDLDTMPDHSEPSQTDVAEPTNAYALGIINFFLVGGRCCSCHTGSFP